MKGEQLTPEVREGLKLITVASERAANLTKQLLAFGRKQSLRLQPLGLNGGSNGPGRLHRLVSGLDRVIVATKARLARV